MYACVRRGKELRGAYFRQVHEVRVGTHTKWLLSQGSTYTFGKSSLFGVLLEQTAHCKCGGKCVEREVFKRPVSSLPLRDPSNPIAPGEVF